ncbi:DUF3108 domain-containing protein [Parvibaculum sp.]|uniref:DUF3108 domain-containing protein n=1 Tax=Parvibaculum sp. TaxID=2024848 RepID=UPI0034A048EB
MANIEKSFPSPLHRAACLLLLLGALTIGLPAPASAADEAGSTEVDLTYRLYGGGLLILSLDTRAELDATRYRIASDIATEGLVDRFFHGRMSSRAHGLLTEAGPRMQRYRQHYKGSFGERSVDMRLADDGGYDVEAEPDAGYLEHGPLDPKAVVGTVDPLTASIYAALAGAGKPCANSIPVFDGRRVYDLDFSPPATERLVPRIAGEFAGDAWRCKILYKPKSGFTREWHIKRIKDPLRPAIIWLARFEGTDNGDGEKRSLLLPVRLEISSAYFSAVAHLTRASIDGRELIASSEDTGG